MILVQTLNYTWGPDDSRIIWASCCRLVIGSPWKANGLLPGAKVQKCIPPPVTVTRHSTAYQKILTVGSIHSSVIQLEQNWQAVDASGLIRYPQLEMKPAMDLPQVWLDGGSNVTSSSSEQLINWWLMAKATQLNRCNQEWKIQAHLEPRPSIKYVYGERRYIHCHQPGNLKGCTTPSLHTLWLAVPPIGSHRDTHNVRTNEKK